MISTVHLTRRQLLRAAGLAGGSALAGIGLAGCSTSFADQRLSIGTGGTQGVYYTLGEALADGWQARLGLGLRPTVLTTDGSVANLTLLDSGGADVVFSAADAAADSLTATVRDEGRRPRGLARMHDDVLQVVVRAESPVRKLSDLRGLRVSIGSPDSGVRVIAERLLAAAGLSAERDMASVRLGIDDSVTAMQAGKIDSFFWSGGLPTAGVETLAAALPVRLLDLSDTLAEARRRFPVYDVGTLPAMTYGSKDPVTTLIVRNFLLVSASMADDLAEALVAALFDELPRLISASSVARAIDPRSAIGTQPVSLHDGAAGYYRSVKTP